MLLSKATLKEVRQQQQLGVKAHHAQRKPDFSTADPWIKVTIFTAQPSHQEIQPLINQPRGVSGTPARR